jgi:hypothetical protein
MLPFSALFQQRLWTKKRPNISLSRSQSGGFAVVYLKRMAQKERESQKRSIECRSCHRTSLERPEVDFTSQSECQWFRPSFDANRSGNVGPTFHLGYSVGTTSPWLQILWSILVLWSSLSSRVQCMLASCSSGRQIHMRNYHVTSHTLQQVSTCSDF